MAMLKLWEVGGRWPVTNDQEKLHLKPIGKVNVSPTPENFKNWNHNLGLCLQPKHSELCETFLWFWKQEVPSWSLAPSCLSSAWDWGNHKSLQNPATESHGGLRPLINLLTVFFLWNSSIDLFYLLVFFFFLHLVSLYSPGCLETHSVDQDGLRLRDLPASAYWMLE